MKESTGKDDRIYYWSKKWEGKERKASKRKMKREHPTRNVVLACCEVSGRMEGGMEGRWMRLSNGERETKP